MPSGNYRRNREYLPCLSVSWSQIKPCYSPSRVYINVIPCESEVARVAGQYEVEQMQQDIIEWVKHSRVSDWQKNSLPVGACSNNRRWVNTGFMVFKDQPWWSSQLAWAGDIINRRLSTFPSLCLTQDQQTHKSWTVKPVKVELRFTTTSLTLVYWD